jgi:hypothetical protein
MFPTLVHDNRRKGRSSGLLVHSNIKTNFPAKISTLNNRAAEWARFRETKATMIQFQYRIKLAKAKTEKLCQERIALKRYQATIRS